jgi:hypothetical protein
MVVVARQVLQDREETEEIVLTMVLQVVAEEERVVMVE